MVMCLLRLNWQLLQKNVVGGFIHHKYIYIATRYILTCPQFNPEQTEQGSDAQAFPNTI